MCGIVGIFDLKGTREIDANILHRMNESQHHRGPDEGEIYREPGVGFGHRRLSIIDVASGQQPLFNEDRSVVVVFNGEIYNFQELVPELEAAGHVFRTHSDTEVIVHGWEQWGAEREVLIHEKNALLFKADDPAAFTAAIARLADDAALRARLAQAARSTIEQGGFTWDHNAQRVEALFVKLGCK